MASGKHRGEHGKNDRTRDRRGESKDNSMEIEQLKRKVKKMKEKIRELVERNARLENSKNKADEEVVKLKKRVKTLQQKSNYYHERCQSRRGAPLNEIIAGIGHVFTPIQSDHDGRIIWYQPEQSLRLYSRDFLAILVDRWKEKKPIPVLDRYAVEIRDGKPIIIGDGERTDYANQFSNYLVSVFGEDHPDPALKNLVQYLNCIENGNMNLSYFKKLYWHSFLQSWEEKAAFPDLACQALKDHRGIKLAEKKPYEKWTTVFNQWMENRYGSQSGFDLESQCVKDTLVHMVFKGGGIP